jgi:hypothetical protein
MNGHEFIAARFPTLPWRALSCALFLALAACASQRATTVGFWFEPVTYSSSRFGAPLTPQERKTIESVAREEITRAFRGLRILLSDRRDARFRVRVVQELRDPRFRGNMAVAGSSRAVSLFGGDGAVNFSFLAAGAESFAPPEADRASIVSAIGRGIGRAAVHEFAHQLLGTAQFERTQDRRSYEYGSAAREGQYYGEIHWSEAWPGLVRRFDDSSPRK